jgi:hypothetical protein
LQYLALEDPENSINQKFMKRLVFLQLVVDVVNVIITRVKFWCLVGLFQVMYAPCYVSSDKKGT